MQKKIASLFFLSYEYAKAVLGDQSRPQYAPVVHMVSASAGEISACLVRVPTEVVKQRMQIGQYGSFIRAVSSIYWTDGVLGFFRGYSTTVFRENSIKGYKKREVEPWEAGVSGSIAGGVAAALPNESLEYSGVVKSLKLIVKKEGWQALFKGVGPRVIWISLGGWIFLGMYEKAKRILSVEEQ
ncbi:putative mitochondrial carrier protein PET8 [Zancudomyces culisetae]|uniref:Putative mitochondrial carrier protein PET8 n=1 Tax=Zancudomyces culisetae TaxID=1213189 RepID=A0A1R1PXP2_ZANCU|nr:putative mitochondrial carrier protein PET8 [Zancudomyces culisetae]|eukprot:OMH85723.1 putative mitochondrial carrier protein PET8 [Zancudomyces culisetae]